jgi:hypothetical protein
MIHRLEGGAIASLAAVAFISTGFAWWWLLILFLVFDLSALGYPWSNKAGATGYNLVHNYTAPAVLASTYGILLLAGVALWPLAFIAGCWLFHVGIDRSLGYGPRPATEPLRN